MAFTALLDACVLYPPSIRDLLLSLAVTDLFRARWTLRIQDEWLEAVLRTRPGIAERLQRTQQMMLDAVPDAIDEEASGPAGNECFHATARRTLDPCPPSAQHLGAGS
jgi:hypothetical protein